MFIPVHPLVLDDNLAKMNLLHLVEKAKGFSSNLKLLLDQEPSTSSQEPMMPNVLSREQLKLKLSALQFKVTQEKFTEKPFSGKYLSESRTGFYVCVVCNSKLFDSASKFNSNSGWPSFSDVIERRAVALRPDTSSGECFLSFRSTTHDCISFGYRL
ncbi:hypothetical protein AHF37_11922 [Paragonimus kellicotti]|nr:hypothetical protein AHF37_11922 [Paragonimus kellicotti]